MGIGTLAFISGASKTALSGIQAREEEDRQKRRDELLSKLKLEGDIRLKEIDRGYDLDDYNTKATSVVRGDGDEWVGYTAGGKEAYRRTMTKGEVEAAKRAAEAEKLAQDKIRADMANDASRTAAQNAANYASAENSRASAATQRRAARGLDSGVQPAVNPQLALSRGGDELMTANPMLSALARDSGLSAAALEMAKKNAITQAMANPNAKTPAERQQLAADILNRYLSEARDRKLATAGS